MANCSFRYAEEKDIPIILKFIKELADYEGMLDRVEANEELLKKWLFEKERAEVIFVLEDGKEVGQALFFHNFSTFQGRAGIYIEDLYVTPDYRGRGYGIGLIKELARITVERGCGRLEWGCFDFNTPSIEFYLGLGAEPVDEWTVYRVSGETLEELSK